MRRLRLIPVLCVLSISTCYLLIASHEDQSPPVPVLAHLATPEDFGAKGDGKHDDTLALERFFNSWRPSKLNQSVGLALKPGKVYAFRRPLVITAGASKAKNQKGPAYFRMVLHGNGATLLYQGGPGKGYAIQFGKLNEVKGNRCSIYDTHLAIGPAGADGGFLLEHQDFGVWQNISVNGRIREACIRVTRGYSLLLKQVFLTGGDVGVLAGKGEHSSVNAFHIEDGRILKCRVGVHYSGTSFTIENLDCSANSDTCVQLDGAQYGSVHLYTEFNGPGNRGNDAAIVRMKNCRSVRVRGMLNAANGPINRPVHTGYCVKLEACDDVSISGRGHVPQTAYVSIDERCRNIVIEDTAACDFVSGERGFATAQPAPLADGIRLVNRAAIRLRSNNDPSLPQSYVSADVNEWEKPPSVTIEKSLPGYEGAGSAQVITFPGRSTNAMKLVHALSAAAGNYRIEARIRLAAFLEEDPAKRKTDLAAVFLAAKEEDAVLVEKQARIGEGWQDVWAEFKSAGEPVEIQLGKVLASEPCVVAIDFVRVVKLD